MPALICCLCISSAYVAVLYIWRGQPRNDPRTVVRRFGCLLAVCLVSWVPVILTARHLCSKRAFLSFQKHRVQVLRENSITLQHGLSLLGLRFQGLTAAVIIPLCLTACLFAAPVLLLALDIYQGRIPLHGHIDWLLALRDIAVAPIMEEWAFRACMSPLLLMEGWSRGWTTFIIPFFFGAAHLHHAHEMVSFHGMSVPRALAVAGFQMIYTTIFGWYATWLFLRSGHLVSPVVAHMFCNFMGFPDFKTIINHPHHRSLMLSVLFIGILIFAVCLGPMTTPEAFSWNVDVDWVLHPCSEIK